MYHLLLCVLSAPEIYPLQISSIQYCVINYNYHAVPLISRLFHPT